MKIRTQLVTLVVGVVFPLVLLSGFVTYRLWQQQRQTYQQQFLERASAVRLAIDTQFDATSRMLRATGDATEIPPGQAEVVIRRRFRRLLDNYPAWVAVTLTDAQGKVTMTNVRPGTRVPPLLDLDSIRRTLSAGTGSISSLVATGNGQHVIYVATPITREGAPQGVIYASIEHAHWLDLMRLYPVSKRGTLTLIDKDATVIARTLHDAQWVGKKAPAAYWARVAGQSSGGFNTTGLDGTRFYAAFSRSTASGWVVTAGVPQDEVDDALYWQTFAVFVVGAFALLGAFVAAWRMGRNISDSMLGLLDTAKALAEHGPMVFKSLPNREARSVQKAMANAHTELKEREASAEASAQREAAARAQAESGNRAKNQFLAMMGHELRNPLSAISAAADLLDGKDVSPEARRNSQEVIKRQAGHLAGMVNDLMDVAQLDSGDIVLHKTRLDLAQVASRVVSRFEDTGRCTHLQMRTEHVPAWVDADEPRLEFLITCLLDNACKYTPAGGTVNLVVRGGSGSSVLLVRDTGAGIDADLVGSLFDTFAQGTRGIDRAQGGLGLGLSLARKLVDLHGGAISASSDGPGRGSTFTVTLPRSEPPEPMAPAAPSLTAPRDLVLTIVEDIADIREVMAMLLDIPGRRINEAADGPSGVQTILDGPSDVALVDIGLPGFDGLEVARRVREAPGGDDILLIALTGYGTDADRARALDAGFDLFLVKPFDVDRFEGILAASSNERGRPSAPTRAEGAI